MKLSITLLFMGLIVLTSCVSERKQLDANLSEDLEGELKVSNALTLVWSDEFDSDLSNWRVEESAYGHGNEEDQCYMSENVSVEDGFLVLTAKEQAVNCFGEKSSDYTSGMVRSNQQVEVGQIIEWRVRLVPADEVHNAGLWPAFWSAGMGDAPWPLGGEWDGFEVMTAQDASRVRQSLHFVNGAGDKDKVEQNVHNFDFDWHVFKFQYGPDMIWWMDGIETFRVIEADTSQNWPAPFDSPMPEIRINLALGGTPGPIDPRALPARYEIDYVRIYESR